MKQILIIVFALFLLSSCGSKKKVVEKEDIQEKVEEQIEKKSSKVDSSTIKTVIDEKVTEEDKETTITEIEFEPVVVRINPDSVAVVNVKKKERKTTVKTAKKDTESKKEQTEQKDVREESEKESDIKKESEKDTVSKDIEKEESKNPKYIFWTVLLIAIIGAVIWLNSKLKFIKW